MIEMHKFMPWQGGPELLLWHQISSSFSASFSSSWRQCHPQDPSHWNRTEIDGILFKTDLRRKETPVQFFSPSNLLSNSSQDDQATHIPNAIPISLLIHGPI